MLTSESIKAIAAAVGSYQQAVPYIGKDAKNYRNKYVSLPNFNDKAYPVMEKYGLSMTQFPDHLDGKPALTSRLMHVSGEWMEASFPLGTEYLKGDNPMQDTGIALSYICRYAKFAIMGTAGSDDDAISLDQNDLRPDPGPLPKRPTNKDVSTADPATLSRAQLKKRAGKYREKMFDMEREKFNDLYEDADIAGLAGLVTAIENRLNKDGA